MSRRNMADSAANQQRSQILLRRGDTKTHRILSTQCQLLRILRKETISRTNLCYRSHKAFINFHKLSMIFNFGITLCHMTSALFFRDVVHASSTQFAFIFPQENAGVRGTITLRLPELAAARLLHNKLLNFHLCVLNAITV